MLKLSPYRIKSFSVPYRTSKIIEVKPRECYSVYNRKEGNFYYQHIPNIVELWELANVDQLYYEKNLQSVIDYLNVEPRLNRPRKKDISKLIELNLKRMIKEKCNYLENLKRFFLPLTEWGYEDIFEDEYEKEQEWMLSGHGEIPEELSEL